MTIPPNYRLTPKISRLLQSIEASKQVIDSIQIPKEIELNIKRQSTLKSSLFSARIEGNDLTLDELTKTPKNQKKIEVFNILKVLNSVYQMKNKNISIKDLLMFHQMIMEGLVIRQDLGKFRTEAGAIFNASGIAIYLPPRPSQITPLIKSLIKFINSSKEQFIPVKACLVHFTFEKIHPFLDGNGRVGRVLLQSVLQKQGYGMKGLLPIEEYLDNHRSEYYLVLEDPDKDVTDYLEFMLEAMAFTAEQAKKQILEKRQGNIEDLLLPRRAGILNIIKDQGFVNFDIIRRRFLAVNERTLRFDLKKLQDAGFIRKRGTTKGVYYEAYQKK